MRAYMVEKQSTFAAEMNARLQGRLRTWRTCSTGRSAAERRLEKVIEAVKQSRFERRSQQIHRVFDEYRQWVQDTLTTEPQPYIQVLAAVCA